MGVAYVWYMDAALFGPRLLAVLGAVCWIAVYRKLSSGVAAQVA